jgi:voltage-gated potassium channel Kch
VKPPAPAAHVAPKKVASTGKVGVLIGSEHAGDAVTAAIAKALVLEGISGSVVATTPDVSTIAFAAKKLAASCDVVIVAAIVMDPAGNIVPSLQNALSQISLSTDVPVIPGFVAQASLLESKAMLSALAPNWAKAAASVLAMKNGKLLIEALPEPVIEVAPVLTPQMEDPNALMAVLRESLKSHGARGIAGISRKFRIADDDNSGKIEFKEFVKVIGEHALGWSAKQIRTVFDHFDGDRSGAIDFDEFIFGIRGHLNDRRRQLVLMAFEVCGYYYYTPARFLWSLR